MFKQGFQKGMEFLLGLLFLHCFLFAACSFISSRLDFAVCSGQLLHVVLFGVFVGYLFYKSGENIWSVVSFHVLLNAFAVSVPIIVSDAYPFTFYVAEIASFTVMILALKYLPLKNKLTAS